MADVASDNYWPIVFPGGLEEGAKNGSKVGIETERPLCGIVDPAAIRSSAR